MNEETTAPTSEQTTAPAPEPTLEDVYKSVESAPAPAAAPTYTPPPAYVPPVTPTPVNVPDPYDAENFKAYMAQQAAGTAATQEAVKQLAGFLTQQQMREQQAALQKDLSAAVETVNGIVGHQKPQVIEAIIDGEARRDARFKSLWENRSKNPTAWNNALRALGNQVAKDFSLKVDPALSEAQRARKLSQSRMATTDAPQSDQEEWESLSVEEQQLKMDRMLNASL